MQRGGRVACKLDARPVDPIQQVKADSWRDEDVNRVLAMNEVAERLAAVGAEDSGGTSECFADFMRSERSKYVRLVKDASIRIDS